ncbi:hypothetical protein Glove_578g10 [Diversispora epigaea]|uniref:Uncharacterized protein n=1 Tax=Diversispora epigaea TaxID=1348612 RepID=A0A397GHP0_9GLOM|nr:hypothetical protein Glove_578g10 [Diversispora epigaea]
MSFEEDIWFEKITPFTPAPELKQPEPELEETLSKKSPYKSGHTGVKYLYCLKTYKNAKPTDLKDHIANQCFDNDGLTSQSNIQSATTTITAFTSISNKRRRAQSSITSFYESSSIDVAKEECCTRVVCL